MSSRLQILPKKSYCPWSTKNVLRILRDEEKHAREVATNNQRKNRNHKAYDRDDNTSNVVSNGHYSLFAKEEMEAQNAELEVQMMKEHDERGRRQSHRPSAVGLKSRKHRQSRRDAAAKNKLDPMRAFCSDHQRESNDVKVRVAKEETTQRPREDKIGHTNTNTRNRESREQSSIFRKSSRSEARRKSNHRRRRRRSPSLSLSSSSSSSNDSSILPNSSPSRSGRRKRRRESSGGGDGRRKRGGKGSKVGASRKGDDKIKRELLLRCAHREEQERLRQTRLMM